MSRPKPSRLLLAAAALALLLVPISVVAAKTDSAKTKSHTAQSHKPRCRPQYVAKRVRVRAREHHRLVWVRKWKCLKAPPPSRDCAGTPGSGRPDYARLDACGYPSPDTTGVARGRQLRATGSITADRPGQVIDGLSVHGTIEVRASNVRIVNTEVVHASSCCWGIRIEPGVTGTVLRYDTIHGNDNGSGSLAWAVDNAGEINSVTEDHVYSYNADRILNGPGTVTNSYCLDNATIPAEHCSVSTPAAAV